MRDASPEERLPSSVAFAAARQATSASATMPDAPRTIVLIHCEPFEPQNDPQCGMFYGSFGSKTALYTTTQPTLRNPQIFVIILVFILNKGEKI